MALKTGVIRSIEILAAPQLVPPLDVPAIGKNGKTNWCWASCTAMVLRFLHPPFHSMTDPQLLCFVAENSVLGEAADCCKPKACDKSLFADEITLLWTKIRIGQHRGIVPDVRDRPERPSITDLVHEIQVNGLPVEIGFANPSAGHLIILYGCKKVDGIVHFFYRDPDNPHLDPHATISENELTDEQRPDKWERTWLSLKLVTVQG